MQEYCGDVINFKSYSKSYKMKRCIENPEENRAIFLDVHEAIIDWATWEKVQALQKGTRCKKPTVPQAPSVFSGRLKCPECGGNLNFHFNQKNHDIKLNQKHLQQLNHALAVSIHLTETRINRISICLCCICAKKFSSIGAFSLQQKSHSQMREKLCSACKQSPGVDYDIIQRKRGI